MTISEAISQVDSIKDNTYDQHTKRMWLSNIEMQIYKEIICTHKHDEIVPEFYGYNDDTAGDTVLMADEPYSQLYPAYLESMIDYANGEYNRYNISATNFNNLYANYAHAYNRTHMPRAERIRYY